MSELPIARELLIVERERLARDHYETPIEGNDCDGCLRLLAVIAEQKEIG